MKIAVSQREIILQNPQGMPLVFDGVERNWAQFLAGHGIVAVPNVVDIDHLEFDDNIDDMCEAGVIEPDQCVQYYDVIVCSANMFSDYFEK
jgi:hypothetical protein